jgi:hypothetical protein
MSYSKLDSQNNHSNHTTPLPIPSAIPTTNMPGRDSFPASWLILALAATHPTMTISYKRMSELSSLINEPTTKSTFDHAFREVKKQAIALAEQAKQKEAAGEKLDEVKTGEAKKASPVKKGGKRGNYYVVWLHLSFC